LVNRFRSRPFIIQSTVRYLLLNDFSEPGFRVSKKSRRFAEKVLVHPVRDWYSGVAIKMGRRQGATREHI
jgi:hypothetical protein